MKQFPSASGYRAFLIDAEDPQATEEELSFALEDYGLELTPATRRLAEFSQVQNTYLDIFQALADWHCCWAVSASAWWCCVMCWSAVGNWHCCRRWVFGKDRCTGSCSRTWRPVGAGIDRRHGECPAGRSTVPDRPGQGLPVNLLKWIIGGILVSGLFWTWLASVVALRGRLLTALRSE